MDYNNFRKVKITRQTDQSVENDPFPSRLKINEKDNDLDSLIIDDNTVYEIDLECFERAKRNRMNQRTDRNRR
ncbi:hypothetical protein [Anaerocolumna aminovalerica]|uniref:hypothetical protein n=1 Tax=Anaerocolumna aminovalerica TaxID=1527 RepID=UPI000BE46A74|nr:hypothetical protein [Anaerocolumna aminovalerica]MBU5334431.1 hypothetical protein [Anaerocolumna aminovalerica]